MEAEVIVPEGPVMLVDRIQVGEDGEKIALPQMDSFISSPFRGDVDRTPEHVAWEQHIDAYLWAFCPLYFQVASQYGPEAALDMILVRRDADGLRCRVVAAKELAAEVQK